MASLPGGFELEMHVADETRSRAVSASLVRVCMVEWLRAGQLSRLWCKICCLQCLEYWLRLILGCG